MLFAILPISFLNLIGSFKVTKKNIEIAFPGLAKEDTLLLSKQSYKETLKSFYESIFAWSRSRQKIVIETRRINDRFFFTDPKNNSGLVVFSLHNRSIDFMLRWLSTQRAHTSLYKKIKFNALNAHVKKVREEGGNTLVETGIGGVKSIMSALNKGQMTCMASDQVPADGLGKYSIFFNHECYSFSLAPSLAKKTSKPTLMVNLSFENNLGHTISFIKPDDRIATDEGVHFMNKAMEQAILKKPEEYSWEYKKYRKLSSDTKDIYKI